MVMHIAYGLLLIVGLAVGGTLVYLSARLPRESRADRYPVGRYQMHAARLPPEPGSPGEPVTLILDTATGQVWRMVTPHNALDPHSEVFGGASHSTGDPRDQK